MLVGSKRARLELRGRSFPGYQLMRIKASFVRDNSYLYLTKGALTLER